MILRPFLPEDAATMQRLLTDPVIGRTFMLPDYPDPEAALPLFRRMMDLSHNENRYVRGICINGILIGFMNDTEIKDKSIELGYVIDPVHHGKGYMTHALTMAINELFEKGFETVIAGAFAENAASIRVMEKCGMQRLEHTDSIEYRGKTHPCVYYSIQKQE